MLKLKLHYFGHLMRRTDSLEKTLMLGKRQEEKGTTEDEMVGWHHRLDGHELSKLWELVTDRKAWRAAVHGVATCWTWLSDWTEPTVSHIVACVQVILTVSHVQFLYKSIIIFPNGWRSHCICANRLQMRFISKQEGPFRRQVGLWLFDGAEKTGIRPEFSFFFCKCTFALTETLNFVNRKLRMLLSSSAETTAKIQTWGQNSKVPHILKVVIKGSPPLGPFRFVH